MLRARNRPGSRVRRERAAPQARVFSCEGDRRKGTRLCRQGSHLVRAGTRLRISRGRAQRLRQSSSVPPLAAPAPQGRVLLLPAKTETSRRSRGASRSRSLAQGAGGDREGGGTPEVLSPLDAHRSARSQRREPGGLAPGGRGSPP